MRRRELEDIVTEPLIPRGFAFEILEGEGKPTFMTLHLACPDRSGKEDMVQLVLTRDMAMLLMVALQHFQQTRKLPVPPLPEEWKTM